MPCQQGRPRSPLPCSLHPAVESCRRRPLSASWRAERVSCPAARTLAWTKWPSREALQQGGQSTLQVRLLAGSAASCTTELTGAWQSSCHPEQASLAGRLALCSLGSTLKPRPFGGVLSWLLGAAARNLKPATMELGGKSAVIVFPDVDIDKTVEWIAVRSARCLRWLQGDLSGRPVETGTQCSAGSMKRLNARMCTHGCQEH